MKKRSGFYPMVKVGTAPVTAVGAAGGVLLTGTVAASGLDRALSAALEPFRSPWARHGPGKVLTDLAITLALGGDACSDAAVFRAEPGVYGPVASDPTILRTITAWLATPTAPWPRSLPLARPPARTCGPLPGRMLPAMRSMSGRRWSSIWTQRW